MERGGDKVLVTFEQWTQGRELPSYGTNSGAEELPFQRWRHFKEAFAPEIVARAIAESNIPVGRCLDPFGGSGTTALACQFLGVHPVIAEVNPFLADLIEAKLTTYNPDHLVRDLAKIAGTASKSRVRARRVFAAAPKTFVEPGVNGRWIFDRATADRVAVLLTAINSIPDKNNSRLFRVLLGGVLVEVSNVVVNGKGRRYRRNWEKRQQGKTAVDHLFYSAAQMAIADVHRFSKRKNTNFELVRGDSRKLLRKLKPIDLSVFSPPYPNSFDYTDVYNIELWTLGYLDSATANRLLRHATISSHVQIGRDFADSPSGSSLLKDTLKNLHNQRADLWDQRIPEMVGAYFADLLTILDHIHRALRQAGDVWMVVGNSQYAGTQISTAEIIAQVVSKRGWKARKMEPFRSMRVSAQQGGQRCLDETLLVLRKRSGSSG